MICIHVGLFFIWFVWSLELIVFFLFFIITYIYLIITGPKLRQSPFSLKTSKSRSTQSLHQIDIKETDFYALQARLQTEARIALAQAKEMAHIQMEV